MSPQPRVLVAHPGTQHAQQAALAFQEAGLLERFVTGLYYVPGGRLERSLRLLPERIAAPMLRRYQARQTPGLDAERVDALPFWEWATVVSQYVLPMGAARRVAFLRNRRFDRRVRRLVRGADIALGWNGASLEMFSAAREHGVFAVLDQSIGHLRSLTRILAEEIELHPEFRGAFDAWVDPAEVERESREAELADLVLAGSEFAGNTLRENGVPAERIRVVPYGADCVDPAAPARKPGSAFRLLMTGGFTLRKGTLYLLEAWQQLALPECDLLVLGALELEQLARRHAGRYRHRLVVPRQEMPAVYAQADVFCLPTLFEGSSLSVYEAMQSGLPVITTPNAGSVVRDSVDGFLVPIRDVERLKEKIELLYRDLELRRWMGQNARQHAAQYTWQRYRQRLVETTLEAYGTWRAAKPPAAPGGQG